MAGAILVTGGAGFIGSHVVARAAARGQRVVVADWLGTGEKWRNLARHEVSQVVAPEDLARWLAAGPALEAVVHMGAISATTETDVDLILRTNLTLSQSLWRWCAHARVPFVYASSAATYGDGTQGFDDDMSLEALARLRPLNAYGWSKHLFDRWVARELAAGEPAPPHWAGLKFFNVYGPNETHKGTMKSVVAHIFPKAAAGEPVTLFRSHDPRYPDGGQLRDFVSVKDCADVVMWLLQARVSGLFNVGTGEARTFRALAEAVFAALNRAPQIAYVDTPVEIRAKYQYFTQARMERLRAAGYTAPFTTLEDGVADYVRNHLAAADPYA